jgi:hypothetical protein
MTRKNTVARAARVLKALGKPKLANATAKYLVQADQAVQVQRLANAIKETAGDIVHYSKGLPKDTLDPKQWAVLLNAMGVAQSILERVDGAIASADEDEEQDLANDLKLLKKAKF